MAFFSLAVVCAMVCGLLAQRPPPPAAIRIGKTAWQMNATWSACDVVVRPLCHRRWQPLDVDAEAIAGRTTASLEAASGILAWRTTRHSASRAIARVARFLLIVQHSAVGAHATACDYLQGRCDVWTCPMIRRGACFASRNTCKRLSHTCAERLSSASGAGTGGTAPIGGVGPPANWGSGPPTAWEPVPWVDVAMAASEPAVVRGAHPWLQERWREEGVHTCRTSSAPAAAAAVELDMHAVNDGWCDCADGSDEPGTHACAGRGGRFWCPGPPIRRGAGDGKVEEVSAGTGPDGGDEGGESGAGRDGAVPGAPHALTGEWIDASLVDDGICDCCAQCADEPLESPARSQHTSTGHTCEAIDQASADSPPEPWDMTSAAELAAAAVTVRSARAVSAAGVQQLHAQLEQLEGLLQRRPTSMHEQQQMQQMAQHYHMIRGALAHGFGEPSELQTTPPGMQAHPLDFLPLLDTCANATLCAGGCSSHSEPYYWEVCPFRSVSQAPTEGGRPTLVGLFAGWNATVLPSLVAPGASLSRPRPLWEFADGEGCWEGPARSARVELRCGAQTELMAVDEDGKCRYSMLMRTPFACRVPWDGVLEAAATASHEEARERAARQHGSEEGGSAGAGSRSSAEAETPKPKRGKKKGKKRAKPL